LKEGTAPLLPIIPSARFKSAFPRSLVTRNTSPTAQRALRQTPARLDPRLARPVNLTDQEFADLLEFIRNGLLDPRALPENLARLIPASVPSGLALQTFESTPPTR